MNPADARMLEVDWEEGARQLNECKYLFVDTIREVEELTLELVVTEAKVKAQVVPASGSVSEYGPIITDATCRIFRLTFDRRRMICYTVLNETYGIYPSGPEQFNGHLFRIFSWSHMLEFVKRTTHALNEEPLQHYQVACLNHVVDVICTGAPTISVAVPSITARTVH